MNSTACRIIPSSRPVQMTLSKPFRPPCNVLARSLASSLYSVPSSVNFAPPMRLATRPTIALEES